MNEGGMNGLEIIGITSSGVLFVVLLLIAVYSHGHRNGKATAGALPPTARPDLTDNTDAAFVLNSIDDGVAMIDQNGTIKLFNPAAARISGWQISEVVGLNYQSVLQLVDEKGQKYNDKKSPFYIATGSGQTTRDSKASLVTRSGKQLPISIVVSPVANGAIGVFRDIANEKAEETERTEFISTASHEMRTPIASIEGYLSLVLNDKKAKIDTASREYLEKAHTATQHLGQLFRDLLTTTKAEDDRLAGHPEPIDISKVITEVVEEIRQAAEKKKLSLHIVTSGDTQEHEKVLKPLYYVLADSTQLKEVFQNLLDNAVKYTSAGGVTVKLTGDDSIVQVQVSDTGMGIPPEDVPHLFQKFYRVDSTMTREVGGTGLGLFICRKILGLYGGKIWVESQLGKGSTFFVNLPRMSPGNSVPNRDTIPK